MHYTDHSGLMHLLSAVHGFTLLIRTFNINPAASLSQLRLNKASVLISSVTTHDTTVMDRVSESWRGDAAECVVCFSGKDGRPHGLQRSNPGRFIKVTEGLSPLTLFDGSVKYVVRLQSRIYSSSSGSESLQFIR